MEVEEAYAELLTPDVKIMEENRGGIKQKRIEKKQELQDLQELQTKTALQNVCIRNGQRRKIIPRRLDMDALDTNNTNNEDDSMWRYDWHGMVVIADSAKRVIDTWETNGGMSKNCLLEVRSHASERQAKARDKLQDMQRKRERDRKSMRVRFYERGSW